MDIAHALALMSVKDAAPPRPGSTRAFKQTGATTTTETYGGTTLTLFAAG